MAFYPDELSPIDRLRNASNPDFADINLISKSRRQWKSLILGKKDVGVNSFATITEEKEEEISNDGSQPSNANQTSSSMPSVQNKRISFPKPRKYISGDRVDDEEIPTLKKLISPIYDEKVKMNLTEVKQLIKGKKDNDSEFQKTDMGINYFREDDPVKNWKDMTTTSAPLLRWPKKEENKTVDSSKGKIPDKKKAVTAPLMNSVRSADSKSQKKTQPKSSKPSPPEEVKKTPERSAKSLNMRDVVNVYKNLTYGSKEEIKSFVEKLSFVKGDTTDKDKLSMMNLKALESKLKDFGKRSNKVEEKKPKEGKKKGKPEKLNHKARINQLARHKVIKVPATLNYTYSPESQSLSYASSDKEQILARRRSQQQRENKTPWKYVGTQSVLDKNYFVYPTIPSTPPKKTKKSSFEISKNNNNNNNKKEEKKIQPTPNQSSREKKWNEFSRKRPSSIMRFSGSNKSMSSRSSATTVCKIEFRPTGKIGDLDPDDPSLLVYLHGTKAINVKLPYADKQFSRVKFFRQYGSRVPLIKGIDRDALSRDYQNVSVKNIRLPSELSRYKLESLLDFDEDIQNLNDFLNSQSDSGTQGFKKNMKNSSPREESTPKTSPKLSPDSIIQEISQDIKSLQHLPDTEQNRKIIAKFFDELDQRIEMTKAQKFVENAADRYGQMIPIVGY